MSCLAKATHITSLIVNTHPETWHLVVDQVKQLPSAEIHSGDSNAKFIVLLETDNEQQILDAINQIQAMNGVISAAMVYHQVDE